MATARDVPDLHQAATVAVLTLGEIERKEVQRRRDEADIPHDRVFALRLGYLVENGISIHTAIESVRPESMWYT